MNFYLARQPIFDRNQIVIGYEIIYRSSLNSPEKVDSEYDEATSRLLLNSYLDIGMDTLIGGHIAFINFDRELVLKDSPLLLNKSTTIIQIPSDIVPDSIFLDKISEFKNDGYLISLAGYLDNYPHINLLELVDIIQVDLTKNTASSLKRIVKRFQMTTQILLAKNIESHDSYETLKRMGFELFQGYYFCKPTLTKGKILQHSNLNNVEILKLSNESEPNIKEISKRIEEDINLTIKLLRLVNSSHYFMNKIQSVQHALAMVGVQSFKNWLNIALMDSLLGEQTPEIIKLSMVRMKMMEEIGHIGKSKLNTDSLKLIGLLSVLDALLDKNMMDAVGPLPIERELKITLFGKDTIYTPIYRLVLGYEKGDFNIAYRYAEKAGIHLDALPQIYAKSIQWADDLYNHIYPSGEPTVLI
ncbi:EAL and HDOD domain-containing protein [Petrocella sp. FN5]|uniref:EAL and HDOD domain-containing protein n=1 Tax=Petrocella sp. FN5 TaxID=3032002 RepID=UPI0023DB6524|nr:HDOD domain-containing protein [Petrocella sp. FN5]MDF1618583.1 HDOD domain-containing protein [Petrocella sp. FN5]